MNKIELSFIAFICIVVLLLLYVVLSVVTGKWQHVEIIKPAENVECAIVSRGSNISIDCWVLEEQR